MTNPDDRIIPIDGDPKQVFQGLTKREYFAGLAMQNLQNVLLRKSGVEMLGGLCEKHGTLDLIDVVALEAVAQADALINALNGDIASDACQICNEVGG